MFEFTAVVAAEPVLTGAVVVLLRTVAVALLPVAHAAHATFFPSRQVHSWWTVILTRRKLLPRRSSQTPYWRVVYFSSPTPLWVQATRAWVRNE